MKEFIFEHKTVTTKTRFLRVSIYSDTDDAAMQAEIKATCGPIGHILNKEGVELIGGTNGDEVTVNLTNLEAIKTALGLTPAESLPSVD